MAVTLAIVEGAAEEAASVAGVVTAAEEEATTAEEVGVKVVTVTVERTVDSAGAKEV